ncbi:radical SAM protein [Candidatus Aerophobetes bacterium]|nr:radical SAM protein [Candidatus Aerophobetes bacterium]
MKKVNYLRVSVTDRCNFNCIYCRPYERVKILDRAEILSFEEITKFIRLAGRWGIKKIRITGGEPLIRKDIVKLVSMISKIKEIE